MTATSERARHALATHGLLDLAAGTAALRGVRLDELLGRRRHQSLARARHELWWAIRNHPDRHYSFVEIARLFGVDHSTVLAGVRAHAARLARTQGNDRDFRGST